jgi:hypothetical protein
MPLRQALLALATLLLVVGCQAPAAVPPTLAPPTPAPPTPAPPTPVPPTPPPLIVPSPSAPPVGSTRVDTLNAANAAFQAGDLASASMLYERVLNTPPTGEAATVSSAINDFAHFRAMVTLLADGREDDARAQLDALQQADANAPLARLGSQLWDQYGMVGQLRGACVQLQPQIVSQAGATLTVLQTLGVTVDAQTLCSVPNR